MELLKKRIREEGKILPGNIVKVDGFLNHRVDTELMEQIAEEFKKRFDTSKVTLVLTAEASGIALATICARAMGVDVREYAQIKGAVDFAIATFGQVDYTVSCAGGSSARVLQEKGSSFKEWSVSTLDWGIDVNLRAPMYLAHAVIRRASSTAATGFARPASISSPWPSSTVPTRTALSSARTDPWKPLLFWTSAASITS